MVAHGARVSLFDVLSWMNTAFYHMSLLHTRGCEVPEAFAAEGSLAVQVLPA